MAGLKESYCRSNETSHASQFKWLDNTFKTLSFMFCFVQAASNKRDVPHRKNILYIRGIFILNNVHYEWYFKGVYISCFRLEEPRWSLLLQPGAKQLHTSG